MTINNKRLSKWKRLYQHGDKMEIRRITGTSRAKITVAFQGAASEELIQQIDEFYEKREAKHREMGLTSRPKELSEVEQVAQSMYKTKSNP